jgi:hypothetical protein
MRSETPTDVSSTDLTRIAPTELFDALANDRRQQVIRAVADEARTIGELADHLARVEHDLDPDSRVGGDLRKRTYVALYQNHLQPLDELDIVCWDKQSGTVTAGPAHQQAHRTLEFVIGDASLRDYVREVPGGEA